MAAKIRKHFVTQHEPFKDDPALAHRSRAAHSGQVMWVDSVPGEGGVDWGYTPHSEGAKALSPYWQRRFAADMSRVNDGAVFLAKPLPAELRAVPSRQTTLREMSMAGTVGRPSLPPGTSSAEVGLYDTVRSGDKVTIVDRFGKISSGRAVMRGPAGWVLNMGGRHGTPAIASPENITAVRTPKAKVK
jgi:hypothetical protein